MFGFLRTTLALMVMVYHLFVSVLPLGTYAVFGFYIISGYLMTLVMHENYGHTWKGRSSFAINRFLRLYPQYWAAAIFSVLLISALGVDVATSFHKSIFLPISAAEIFSNVFLAFTAWFPNSIDPRLVPPAWALTVEIFFYILICLGISKTVARVQVWLFVSLCYVIISYIIGWSWQSRYFPVAAASLPFAIGSAIYFASESSFVIRQFPKLRISSNHLFLLMLFNCLFWTAASLMNIGNFVELGFYINIAICTLLVYSLATGNEIININKNTDKVIGDYSYPIYLIHWQSGLLVSFLIFGESFHEFSGRGFISLFAAIAFVYLISYFFIRGIDEPLQRIRSKIKTMNLLK